MVEVTVPSYGLRRVLLLPFVIVALLPRGTLCFVLRGSTMNPFQLRGGGTEDSDAVTEKNQVWLPHHFFSRECSFQVSHFPLTVSQDTVNIQHSRVLYSYRTSVIPFKNMEAVFSKVRRPNVAHLTSGDAEH